MTMVIATKLNNNSLHLHGDSIETLEVSASSGFHFPEGVTSQNEKTQHTVIDEDKIHVYREKACKIGRLSNRVACSVSGYADLAYQILDIIYSQVSSIDTLDSLRDVLFAVKTSFEGTVSYRNQDCHLLFVCNFNKIYACGAYFHIMQDGSVKLELKLLPVEGDSYWQITEGSGLRYMRDYFPGGVKNFVDQDNSGEKISTEMLSFDYSAWLRFKNSGVANGVGGAIFGLKMSQDSCTYMNDTILLYADYRGSLEVAVKIMQRDGLFLVTDFISRSVTGMRTLEAEIEYRRNPTQANKDVTDLVKEALRFQAPLTLIDSRSPTNPLVPDVGIIENANGTSVGNMEFNVEIKDGLPYFPAGTQLNLKSRDQEYNFTVRIP